MDLKTARAITAAQREALMFDPGISAPTRRINPKVADLFALEAALDECEFYLRYAYPEIEGELCEQVHAMCVVELIERYSRHGTTVLNAACKRLGITQ